MMYANMNIVIRAGKDQIGKISRSTRGVAADDAQLVDALSHNDDD